MSTYFKVEGHSDLIRDSRSGAIVNTNRSKFLIAKKRCQDATKHKDQMRSVVRQINTLKCEMHEIKDMLKILLDRN